MGQIKCDLIVLPVKKTRMISGNADENNKSKNYVKGLFGGKCSETSK